MLNSGKKIRALRDKNNKYSNSRVVRRKISERNKKPYPPPLQVKWSVPDYEQLTPTHNIPFTVPC
jgi:hypothetical protein